MEQPRRFSAGLAISESLSTSISFIIALALNEAFLRTFRLVPVADGLLGLWLYALTAIVIGVLLLCLINWIIQPALIQVLGSPRAREA